MEVINLFELDETNMCQECHMYLPSHRKWCKEYRKQYKKTYHQNNKEYDNNYTFEWRQQLRQDVLKFYSKSEIPYCACCHETTLEFLCIDHINGGGAKHGKEIGRSKLYLWLKKNNFPNGFRVLCHNCNQSLGCYGYCPHNKKEKK